MITYEQIKEVLKQKGYSLKAKESIPKGWSELKGRTLVTITPEMAQSLLAHSEGLTLVLKQQFSKVIDSIEYGTWTSDMDEIDLLQNYKLWGRSDLIQAIADGGHPVGVYVNMKEDNKFGFGDDNTKICNLLLTAIKNILKKQNKELPEVDNSIWEEELPKELSTTLDITLYDEYTKQNETIGISTEQILVGVLNPDRTEEFPDILYIIDNNSTGEADSFKCNMFPAKERSQKILLKPGIYKELFSPDYSSDIGLISLIQASPAKMDEAILENNKIVDYKPIGFDFMRIGIPVKEEELDSGIIPVGVKFDSTNTEDLFITAFNFDYVEKPTTYIVLEKQDFE